MRILIFTSSGGTAHDAAAEALRQWLARWAPGAEVRVEQVLENASPVTRFGVDLYNWIQKHGPWLHQLYWRLVEFEDLIKPGTLLFGRAYVIRLLRRFRPDLLISTHPHTNRGHFDLAKRLLGPQLRCVTCCTELDGGFGFSRNWLCRRADAFWAITPEVAAEVVRRGYPAARAPVLGPLLFPPFHREAPQPAPDPPPDPAPPGEPLPLLVLGAGANGANNHPALLEALRPLAGRLAVVALCGRRRAALERVRHWSAAHPELQVEALGFQGPEAMAALYRRAWALVARPGARTATEALVSGCPLVFNVYGGTMPQELLARRHFRARGVEVVIRSPRQLAALVTDWLDQPRHPAALRAAYRRHRLTPDLEALRELLLNGFAGAGNLPDNPVHRPAP